MSMSTAIILKIDFDKDTEVTDGIIAELVGTLLYHHDHPDYVEKLTFIHNGRRIMTRSTLERSIEDAEM